MSVNVENTKKIYSGNGVTREWLYDFPLLSADYLEVYLTAPDGLPVKLTSCYTVDTAAKKVKYPASDAADALASGYTLTLVRATPTTQPMELPNQQGRFLARNTEKGLDRATMQIQELEERLDRTIVVPVDNRYSPEELRDQIIDTHERYAEIVAANAESVTAKDAAIAAASGAEASEAVALAAQESALNSATAAEAAKDATLAAAQVTAWDATTTYSYPALVAYTDGHTYRCIGTNVTGVPVPPESTQWVRVTELVQAPDAYDWEDGGSFDDSLMAFEDGGTF